ncbi:MAG TPA: hypothetical protein VNX21_09395, partial [Candidatus Thermoplasmatota archaeon]|nr:hypothetical protein [Candidatus Thermoplasmatota archaeon]
MKRPPTDAPRMRAVPVALLLLLLAAAPVASALALPDVPVPRPLQRAVLAVDRAVTGTVHETLAPFEPPAEEEARLATDAAAPHPGAGAVRQEDSGGDAPLGPALAVVALGIAVGMVGGALARRPGRASRAARAAGLAMLLLGGAWLALDAGAG